MRKLEEILADAQRGIYMIDEDELNLLIKKFPPEFSLTCKGDGLFWKLYNRTLFIKPENFD